MDKDKQESEKAGMVFETGEVITTKIYKVSPEQKEQLDRQAEERIKQASEQAILKLRERYEQRVQEIRQQQRFEADGEEGTQKGNS